MCITKLSTQGHNGHLTSSLVPENRRSHFAKRFFFPKSFNSTREAAFEECQSWSRFGRSQSSDKHDFLDNG